MAKNFVQVGENLTLPVAKDVKSGELVQVGEIIGVALTDAKTDDGTSYYTTIATKGVWDLTLKMTTTTTTTTTTKAGSVVSALPKGGSKHVPVGFALENFTLSSTDIVVPVLLCLGLAYGAANPPASSAANPPASSAANPPA